MTDHRSPGWRVQVDQPPAAPGLPARHEPRHLPPAIMQPPAYFVLRVVRDGPLVPARLWWCDHEPQEPDNKLDRGRLSVFPRADIADVEVPPEELIERTWAPLGHWKYAEPTTATDYDYRVRMLRWAERNNRSDPGLAPRKTIAPGQLELPNFNEENAL